MASGNGRMSAAWAWDEALCGVVPPLISPLNATGELDPDADLRERGEERERSGRDVVERQHPDDERGGEREDDQGRRHSVT